MRVLIADDHDLLRDTLTLFLGTQSDVEVESAADLVGALDLTIRSEPFDVIVLDLDMPGMDGFSGLQRMNMAAPGTPIAILTGSARRTAGREALAGGAKGFLPKTLPARTVLNALRFIAAGETYVPHASVAEPPRTVSGSPSDLSARERQVLAGLLAGLANKVIARDLDLSEPTVKFYVRGVCRKLDARNRTHAVIRARELGLEEEFARAA